MLLLLEWGRGLSPVLRESRESVGHLGSPCPCRSFPQVNQTNSSYNRAAIVLGRRHSESRRKADLCCGFKAAWRVAPLRSAVASVCAAPVRDFGNRRDLLG